MAITDLGKGISEKGLCREKVLKNYALWCMNETEIETETSTPTQLNGMPHAPNTANYTSKRHEQQQHLLFLCIRVAVPVRLSLLHNLWESLEMTTK